ncbi:MAG TPA: glycosyltransferase family 39 protein, partial [Polyangiales bacterium]|nr:glycosyltransferase family 39 protein [Polyangiales bacterium]
VAGTYRLAGSLAGRNAALLAAGLLLLTPVYYGHMFINPADLPFAVAYVWGLFYGARFAEQWPRPRAGTIAGAGIAIGLGASMRIGGMLVLGFVLLLLLARLIATIRSQGRSAGTRLAATGLGPLCALLVVGYGALLALWPAALLSPLAVPWASLLQAAAYPKHEPVLLAGSVFWSDQLPWFYQLGHLLVQLPEQWLLAVALGVPVVAAGLHAALRASDVARAAPAAMVLLGAVVPLACACVVRPVDYDGMRHVLFVVPPLACLAGAGLCFALQRLALRPARCALLVALLAGGSLRTLDTMIELHPYQYVYYNALAGGTPGAHGRFELDYWVTSFGDALGQLGAVLAREPRAPGAPPQRLLVCGHAAVAYMYLPPNVVLSRELDRADFVLATTKWSCQDRYPGEVVAQVQRMGVPFAVIKRLRPPLVTATAAR